MELSEQMIMEQRNWQAEQSRLADERHAESMKIANKCVQTANRAAVLGAISAIVAGFILVGVMLSPVKSPTVTRLPVVAPVPIVNTPAPVVNVILPEKTVQEFPPIPMRDKPEIKSQESAVRDPLVLPVQQQKILQQLKTTTAA